MADDLPALAWAVIAALAIIVVVSLVVRLSPGPAQRRLPYQKQAGILTPAEQAFYEVLHSVVGNDLQVFAKVRLADVVKVRDGVEGRQTYFNRIQSKHIDFVLCGREDSAPVLAVELDDSTHARPDRLARDTFVDEVLLSAGLPILRVPARHFYSPRELSALIRSRIKGL